GATTIHGGGDDYYYYHDHHYYWPFFYGAGVYYQEIYPTYGTTTYDLPPETQTESVNGTDYYVYDDVHYVKEADHYVVTAPPAETGNAASAVSEPNPVELTKAMCAHVAAHSNFLVESTEQVESPSKGPITVQRRILVSRPGRIAAAGRDGSALTHFWYDG